MKFSPYVTVLLAVIMSCNERLSSDEILSRSIAFHDPMNEWSTGKFELFFNEYRANGMIRKARASFDLPESEYHIYRQGQYTYQVKNDVVKIDSGDITLARALTIKDYYLYLWGLPMKLKDPGTQLGDWQAGVWEGVQSLEVPVFYEKDTWYFHFDVESFELKGYKFYNDSAKTKGETILLSELAKVSEMRIPKERRWYTIPENNYLGKDVLICNR